MVKLKIKLVIISWVSKVRQKIKSDAYAIMRYFSHVSSPLLLAGVGTPFAEKQWLQLFPSKCKAFKTSALL